MLGTTFNAIAIVIGSIIGLLIGKHIKERFSDINIKL
jgi:uncharacterized membrane protein YqgA involved in biofilm formation